MEVRSERRDGHLLIRGYAGYRVSGEAVRSTKWGPTGGVTNINDLASHVVSKVEVLLILEFEIIFRVIIMDSRPHTTTLLFKHFTTCVTSESLVVWVKL
jgi:hypothetical protein